MAGNFLEVWLAGFHVSTSLILQRSERTEVFFVTFTPFSKPEVNWRFTNPGVTLFIFVFVVSETPLKL